MSEFFLLQSGCFNVQGIVQVHSFRLERAREEEAMLRASQSSQASQNADTPRFSSLLLQPVPAVPSPSLPSPLLRAVPAVPDLPTLSTFTSSTPRALSTTTPPRTRAPFSRSSPTPFRARQRLSPISAVPRLPSTDLPSLPQPQAQTQSVRQRPQVIKGFSTVLPVVVYRV